MEVAHLKFAQKTDAHHLNSSEDQDAGDYEDGTVDIHDVLAGDELEDKQPGG